MLPVALLDDLSLWRVLGMLEIRFDKVRGGEERAGSVRAVPGAAAVHAERETTLACPEAIPFGWESVFGRRPADRLLTGDDRTMDDRWIYCTLRLERRELHVYIPLSAACLRSKYCHRSASSGVRRALISSVEACLDSAMHAGSGQPTRPTSPSAMQLPQNLMRQDRQATCAHGDRAMH